MKMSDKIKNATYDLSFCGNYLIQYASAFNWSEDKDTQRFALKQLIEFADRVKVAAEIIRDEIETGGTK